ncbi:VOC family protein [Virgifigura deserti]|uniref:VOC family protein n=1 Tax=Virgifigura deserti TaxID=2268457 RepID=UPI003CCC10B7
MLDHIGLRTTQFNALVRFYEAVLVPLGYTKLFAWEGGAGFGRNGAAALWIGASKTKPSGIHIALSAEDRAAVEAFYGAALVAGATDNGKPGPESELSRELLRGVRDRSGRQQPGSRLPRRRMTALPAALSLL